MELKIKKSETERVLFNEWSLYIHNYHRRSKIKFNERTSGRTQK